MKTFIKPRGWEVLLFLLPIVGLVVSLLLTIAILFATLVKTAKGHSMAVVKHTKQNQWIITISAIQSICSSSLALLIMSIWFPLYNLPSATSIAMLYIIPIGSIVALHFLYKSALQEVAETALLWKAMTKEKARV